jgi:Flp pilus assembly protein TadD
VWHLVDILQADTGLSIAADTFALTIKSIQDNRAGKKTVPAASSEFVRTMDMVDNEPAKAVEAADRLLQTKPGDKTFRLVKAYALSAAERNDEGLKLLTELSNEQPPYPAAVFRLAGALSESEPAKAVELYKRYSSLEPYDPRGYHNTAVLYEELKQPAFAEAAYRKAIEVDPLDASTYASLIILLLTNDRPGEIAAVFVASDKYLTAEDDLLATTLNHFPDIKVKQAEQLVGSQPERLKTSIWANYSLANIYALNDKPQTAIDYLNRAEQIDPKIAETHTSKSQVYLQMGRLNDALKAADQALSLDQSSSQAHYNRACALARIGRKKDALASLKTALELKANLKSLLESDSDLDSLRSLPAFKKLVEQTPDPE